MVWRWFDIIPDGETEIYLSRLNLLNTPWFSVKVHWIRKPDQDRHLHDHPWSFLSFVLSGHYDEVTPAIFNGLATTRTRRIKWFNFKSAPQSHRISKVARNTITLVFTGPKVREWGFITESGWVHWRKYVNA